jgi:transketolase
MIMSSEKDYIELEMLARRGRWLAISTVAGSGAGHVGGPFSAMDILVALYFRVMKVDPKEPRMPGQGSIHSFQGTFFDWTI